MSMAEYNFNILKVFSIIVTHNGKNWYDRCFSSLQKSDVPIDIIVVDNASSDGTIDYIGEKFPDITLIQSKENLGFAKANNIGLKYALEQEADYVFLLNQDAWLNQTYTISTLIKQSKENQEYAILSPLQLYGSANKIEREVLMHFARNAEIGDDFISDLYFNRVRDLYNVPFACAVCWLLPIKTVKKIGGFDPLFYHYGEDDNYIHRVRYFGYQVGICPKVSISHDIKERSKGYRGKNLDWRKYLLINLGNINHELNLKRILKRKLRTMLVQVLRYNKKLLKQSYPEYVYLKSMHSALDKSRSQNKIKNANWL
ncbi:MAG: GT2 family glycosyltransferase [Patiriisocius sp.]|jgi:GT2 family glycosyltransferase